jgi:hypothetical protein
MKRRCGFLAFTCMVATAALASAETPKFVSVPAGDLIEGLESLAKQCGLDIIYPSGPLKGRRTQGVNGTLGSVDAFKRLLQGTPLVISEEGGALLITQVEREHRQAGEPISPGPTIDEVEVRARRDKLSVMREQLDELEQQFYAEYNKLNAARQYDVVCGTRPRPNSHVRGRFCRPAFFDEGGRNDPVTGLAFEGIFAPTFTSGRQFPEYQRNMVEVVRKHPELLEILKQRRALADEIARREKR